MWGRGKKKSHDGGTQVATSTEPVAVEGVRESGPWDIGERTPTEEYVDLGSIKLRGREGIAVQLPTDKGAVTAVLVVVEGSAVELRPFAASKSGGDWDEVRDEIVEEIKRRNGEWAEVEGPFGPELLARFPAKDEAGNPAIQPSRIVGIEGPRWVLRATFLGEAGLEVTNDGLLMDVLRDVIVVRGDEPRMLRELLPLRVPEQIVSESADDVSEN